MKALRKFTPRDHLNSLLGQGLPKLLAGEEIEIPLSPGGAPGSTVARGGAKLFVVKARMDHELRDTGLKALQRSHVKVRPFFRRNCGLNGHGMVQHDVVRP